MRKFQMKPFDITITVSQSVNIIDQSLMLLFSEHTSDESCFTEV